MLVISGIFLFTSSDIGYLGNLIKGILSNLLKGIWDTFLFTSRDTEYWYPPIQASLILTTDDNEDPDKMPYTTAFHHCLHCLLRQNDFQRKNYSCILEIVTCDPSTMNSKFITSRPDYSNAQHVKGR